MTEKESVEKQLLETPETLKSETSLEKSSDFEESILQISLQCNCVCERVVEGDLLERFGDNQIMRNYCLIKRKESVR